MLGSETISYCLNFLNMKVTLVIPFGQFFIEVTLSKELHHLINRHTFSSLIKLCSFKMLSCFVRLSCVEMSFTVSTL